MRQFEPHHRYLCGVERYGKIIMAVGVLVVLCGLAVWLAGDKLRFLGRLPGDIRYESGNTRIYIPITTMLLVSILVSVIMWLAQRLR